MKRVATVLTIVLLCHAPSFAQSYVEVYGQNRVQLRKFDWKFFDTKHFRVYHYDKAGHQLSRYVSEEAENNITTIEKKLGGQFPKRFNIILYNSYEDYRQTNIGLKNESQLSENSKAGSLNLVGDKLVVYFTGEHSGLRHQIRSGMARVVMQRMIFGDNFKKVVKNALLLNLPDWVTDGYIAYLVDGWDAQANGDWKSLLAARPNTGFYELAEQYPELSGKAFWKFVSSQYGDRKVKNLLYSMQLKTSLNSAMKDSLNLGMKVTKAYDSCIKFYKNVYATDARNQESPDSTKGLISLKIPKDNTEIKNIRVSPRGSDISYVSWKDGHYTVYSQKTSGEQERSVLLEGGQKDLTEQTDPNYPMMTWSNTGYKMAILYKSGPVLLLRVYNSLKGKIENYVIPQKRFDRVLGMTFTDDDDRIVFSAIKKSQTDLFMFTIKGAKITNITDDAWDDFSPVFVSGGSRTGILFLSNRTVPNMDVPLVVNELPSGPMNIFFYNTKTNRKELLQCTAVKSGNVTQPIQYGLDNFAYLYDGNGINNKYVVLFARDRHNGDSAYSVAITNYSSSIISHQYNPASDEVADVVGDRDQYKVYFHELQMPGKDVPVKKPLPTLLSVEPAEPKTSIPTANPLQQVAAAVLEKENDEEDNKPQLKSGSAFQTEFEDTNPIPTHKQKHKNRNNNAGNAANAADSSVLTEMTDSAYMNMKPAKYRYSFKPDFLAIKLDNSLLFSQYQSIATNGGQYVNPSLSALSTLSLDELLENQRITAGFQLPINVTGSTYFLQYQNFTKRWDWGLVFLRHQDKQTIPVGYVDSKGRVVFIQNQLFKSVTNIVQSDFSRPIDRVRSIRFHTAIRQDRLVEKATDTLSLAYEVPNSNLYTSLSRVEYVFDNTLSPLINIRNGSRYKLYAEYLYGLNAGNRSCYNLGFDFRNYKKLYKNFILANRLAYAHSDGNSEVEYLVGGVDNWIGPQSAASASQAPADNYGFQAMTTPLRGYLQYARTGNNFMVFNTELRLPALITFMKRPIQSAILKNLQVIAFMDAGAAWKGFLPDAESMSASYSFPARGVSSGLNNVFLNITVPNSGGLALGYGLGLRTSLFGYFVRMDAAKNIDDPKKTTVYFSLGTDF